MTLENVIVARWCLQSVYDDIDIVLNYCGSRCGPHEILPGQGQVGSLGYDLMKCALTGDVHGVRVRTTGAYCSLGFRQA